MWKELFQLNFTSGTLPFHPVGKNFYFASDRRNDAPKELNDVEDIKDFANSLLNGMGNLYRIGLKEVEF